MIVMTEMKEGNLSRARPQVVIFDLNGAVCRHSFNIVGRFKQGTRHARR